MKSSLTWVVLLLFCSVTASFSIQGDRKSPLEMRVREPKKNESVVTYFRYLEEEARSKHQLRIRISVGPFGLVQMAELMETPATKLFTTSDDPFFTESTLGSQLKAFVRPISGSVEVRADGKIIITETFYKYEL